MYSTQWLMVSIRPKYSENDFRGRQSTTLHLKDWRSTILVKLFLFTAIQIHGALQSSSHYINPLSYVPEEK